MRLATSGRPSLVWWDTGGVASTETADADLPFADGTTGWIRVRRSGTSVNFWTSTDDTNDHTAVTWTALGTTQTTPAGSIRSTVATFVTIGASGTGGGDPLDGFIYTVAIVDNVTTRANPIFADPTQWRVGEDQGDTAADAQGNTWQLGPQGVIIGDNVAGAYVSVQCAFASTPLWNSAATSPAWFEITDDVKGISTSRGRNYELDRFDAGTASFEIDNTSGWYHSHNTESPYYPNVKPMVPIRVRAVVGGTIYPIWFGFVERWPITHPGNIESIVHVDAVDLFKALSLAEIPLSDRPALVASLSPVAWWRFADDTDSSAAGTHDLTITGASTGDPGIWPNDFAGAFDGVDDFASVANEADVELLSDMSIEMWFKPQLEVAQTVETFNTPGADTWTAPANVTAVNVEVWGAGGGGAAGSDSIEDSGGGGGGGGYGRGWIEVTPGGVYDFVVGAGGPGGVDGFEAGSDGDISSFGDAEVVGEGGQGGNVLSGANGGPGGGATGNLTARGGGRGGNGGQTGTGGVDAGGGGGGGSAGRTGPGGAGRSAEVGGGGAPGGSAGAGGGALGGSGGNGPSSNGSAGAAPGGGGGGGGAGEAGGDGNGGAGANGRVQLTYSAAENMTPISVRGTSWLYHFHWNGSVLKFGPSTSTGSYTLGFAAPDEWHHVLVTIDWTSTTRIIKGYLNGLKVLDTTSSFQPAAEARAVNIGRRASENDQYFKGEISEIAIYPTVLTPTDAAALYAAQLDGFETQLTGARIAYVLDTPGASVGIAITDYDLDPGATIMNGPNSPTDVSALEAIQIAADTDLGQFFIAADGKPTFHDRHYRLIDQATPIATLDQTDYETIDLLGRDDVKVMNDVRVYPSDASDPFIATDDESRGEFGRRTYELTIYPNDQNEAYDFAHYLLERFRQPVDDVQLIPFRLYEEVSDFPVLLGAEIGDRYTIQAPLTGDDLNLDVFVEKVSHSITLPAVWRMAWGVSPAGEAESFWILGVAGSSELGETTVLGF